MSDFTPELMAEAQKRNLQAMALEHFADSPGHAWATERLRRMEEEAATIARAEALAAEMSEQREKDRKQAESRQAELEAEFPQLAVANAAEGLMRAERDWQQAAALMREHGVEPAEIIDAMEPGPFAASDGGS